MERFYITGRYAVTDPGRADQRMIVRMLLDAVTEAVDEANRIADMEKLPVDVRIQSVERQTCRVQILADIIGDDGIGITASDADTGRDIIEDALIRLMTIKERLRVQDNIREARKYMKAAGYGK